MISGHIMVPEPHGSTQPPSPGSSQPDASRQMSATIQRSANDFVVLIENEKAKAREAAERQLAAAEQRNVQFRQQASAAMGAALNRARNAEEQARIAVATMQAKETEVGSLKEQISQLREQLFDQTQQLAKKGGDGSNGQEDMDARVWREREKSLMKEHEEVVANKNAQIDALTAHIAELQAQLVDLRNIPGVQQDSSKDDDTLMAEVSREFLNMDPDEGDLYRPYLDLNTTLSGWSIPYPSPVSEMHWRPRIDDEKDIESDVTPLFPEFFISAEELLAEVQDDFPAASSSQSLPDPPLVSSSPVLPSSIPITCSTPQVLVEASPALQVDPVEHQEPFVLRVPEFPYKPKRFKPSIRPLPPPELRRRAFVSAFRERE